MRRVYVGVESFSDPDGRIAPKSITWEDGRRYTIDRVSEVRQAGSPKTGGQGERYTVMIEGRPKFLYFERSLTVADKVLGRWFVEGK